MSKHPNHYAGADGSPITRPGGQEKACCAGVRTHYQLVISERDRVIVNLRKALEADGKADTGELDQLKARIAEREGWIQNQAGEIARLHHRISDLAEQLNTYEIAMADAGMTVEPAYPPPDQMHRVSVQRWPLQIGAEDEDQGPPAVDEGAGSPAPGRDEEAARAPGPGDTGERPPTRSAQREGRRRSEARGGDHRTEARKPRKAA